MQIKNGIVKNLEKKRVLNNPSTEISDFLIPETTKLIKEFCYFDRPFIVTILLHTAVDKTEYFNAQGSYSKPLFQLIMASKSWFLLILDFYLF